MRDLNRPNNPRLVNGPERRAPTARQHIEVARRRQIPSRVDTGGVDGALFSKVETYFSEDRLPFRWRVVTI